MIVPNDVAGDGGASSRARARHGPLGRRLRAAADRARRRRPAARRATCSTPASASRCWSARARSAPPTRWSRSPQRLGAGVAKALLGKAVVPDDLPFVTGAIGLLGTQPSYEMMQDCDTLLMVGSSFPYSEFLPEEGKARGVQIDIDARMLGMRYPMEVAPRRRRARDAARAAAAARAEDGPRRGRSRSRTSVAKWWELMRATARTRTPTRSTRSASSGSSRRACPTTAILTCDSGTAANWFARDLKLRAGCWRRSRARSRRWGCGVPYAIAAKFAHPDRPAIALVGDGAMQMNGINELITVAKYWKRWSDPRLVVLVLNNRDLNQVTWEQRALPGDPKFPATQEIPDFPYARFAELVGLRGIRVDDPDAARRRPGTRRSRPTGRPCSRRSSTPRCRRCRRTSASSRPSTSPRPRSRATRAAGA